MKEILYIVNPTAGRGKGKKALEFLNSAIIKNKEEIFVSERKGHIVEDLPGIKKDYEVICVVGGDGTLNEAVNGLGHNPENILGVIPCGSGNDFSKILGLTTSCEKNLEIIRNKKTRKVDIGRFEITDESNVTQKSLFINGIGIGFDALVADLIRNTSILRGMTLYLSAVFKALIKYKPVEISARFDNEIVTGEKILVAIGNGKFSGGGFKLNPDAITDDGYLDACIIDNIPKSVVIRKLPLAITGNHVKLPITKTIRFKKAELDIKNPYYVHADGEVEGTRIKRIVVEMDGTLNIIVK